MQTQTVIFLGPQGSGKGTQVDNLIAELGAENVVDGQTGRGFRALKEGTGYTAARIGELLDAGQLVPDFHTYAIVVEELKARLSEDSHVTFDGFPRNVTQAQFLDEVLAFYNRSTISVVYLDTREAVVRERMMGRGRSDDTEESINERLRLYKEQTEPILSYYRERPDTNFIRVDGAGTMEQVFNDIKTGLGI